jgi:hypothetical protein
MAPNQFVGSVPLVVITVEDSDSPDQARSLKDHRRDDEAIKSAKAAAMHVSGVTKARHRRNGHLPVRDRFPRRSDHRPGRIGQARCHPRIHGAESVLFPQIEHAVHVSAVVRHGQFLPGRWARLQEAQGQAQTLPRLDGVPRL